MSRVSARFLVALTAFWLATNPALAADNAIVLTPGAGVTERSKDVGVGVQSPVVINGDTSGNPLITAPGTPNASFALPVQGVTGGSPVPISAASLPLPAGAATATGLTTINTTLGSPFQAGGSIGNTGFNALQGGSANAVGNPFFVSPGTGATWAATQSGLWNVGGAAGAAVTMQNAAVANGNGTSLTVTNYTVALINVNCSVACSGGTTINFEGTDSTGTFFSVSAVPYGGTGGSVNSATTSGQFIACVAGLTSARARISAYSAGTITVTGTPMFGASCPITNVVNANANGQQTSANSSPVALPSDAMLNVPLANLVFGTTAAMTGTTSTQLIAATASKVTYATFIKCTNSSATATLVTVQDGSGGTTLGTLIAPAGG